MKTYFDPDVRWMSVYQISTIEKDKAKSIIIKQRRPL
jgi:hypothetical protein